MENENTKSTVLCVDDNRVVLTMVSSYLKTAGYEVVAFQSGIEALNYIENNRPDLIILDIVMPEINGFDVCRKIMENPETKIIPVIFLTGKSEKDVMIEALEIGGIDFLAKNCTKEELLARVATHIRLKKANEEINKLKGLIPICAKCKKIRNDKGYWEQVESYIGKFSDVQFSHGMCMDCMKEMYPDIYDKLQKKKKEQKEQKEE